MSTTPRIENGWILVDCDAPDHAKVTITIGAGEPAPAFRDCDDKGQRVAKVRPPEDLASRTAVTLTINGRPTSTGKTP